MAEPSSNNEDYLYEKVKPWARNCKICIQMFIGFSIVILLIGKMVSHFTGDLGWWLFDTLINSHPLQIVGYALAVSAGIELAYMLYTPGPDEAIEPLILGLASAILLVISAETVVGFDIAVTILVFTGGVGFLFWVKQRFIDG